MDRPGHIADTPTPAWVSLLRLLTGTWMTQLLHAAVELGLAEALREGPGEADEVARRTGSDPAVTYRLLRALASIGVFEQVAERRFALNPLSERLCGDGPQSLKHLVRMFGAPWHNRIWEAVIEAARTGRSGAEQAFGMALWDYFDANRSEREIFHNAMTEVSDTIGATAVDACDFSGIHRLVDVGGGRGRLLSRVLRRYPQMEGVVFDRPALEGGARAWLEGEGLGARCRFVGGDFLRSVPEGGDAYMLSHILHDWSDSDAVTILGSCRAAMKPGAKLLVLEGVIKPAGEPDLSKLMDIEMLVMFGGRERTAEELSRLFQQAGFALARVVWTQSPSSIVEARAV